MTFLPLLRCEKCCKNIKIGDYKIFKFFANANYVRPPSEDVRCPFSIAMNTPLAIVWYGQAHCTCIRITQKLTPGHAIFLNHGFLIGVGIVHRYEVYISILRWREGISINYGDRCINFVTQGLFPDSSLSPSPPPPQLDPWWKVKLKSVQVDLRKLCPHKMGTASHVESHIPVSFHFLVTTTEVKYLQSKIQN